MKAVTEAQRSCKKLIADVKYRTNKWSQPQWYLRPAAYLWVEQQAVLCYIRSPVGLSVVVTRLLQGHKHLQMIKRSQSLAPQMQEKKNSCTALCKSLQPALISLYLTETCKHVETYSSSYFYSEAQPDLIFLLFCSVRTIPQWRRGRGSGGPIHDWQHYYYTF